MATNGDEHTGSDVDDLRAERDRLQDQVERLQGVKRRRLRAVAAVLAVIVAVVSFSAALPGAWARRTIADTDTYVSVVGPLASDPAVQEALARQITTAVFEALDVQSKLTEALAERAPQLVFLAGPITSSVEGFVQDQVQAILASEQFQQFWNEANRLVQLQVIAVLRGDTTVVQIQNDQVVLNYLPLVNQALQSVSSTVSQLIGKPLTLPEITPDTVPSEAITKLEAALGVTLPDTFGTLVVYDAAELATVQNAVNVARQGLIGLVILFVLAIAVALWVSPRRRRTILQLAVAVAVVTVIERRLGISSVEEVVDIAKPENQAAVRAIAETLVGWFLDYTRTFLVLALLVVAVALLTGPYVWAVALRRGVADLARNAVHTDGSVEVGGASTWVAEHRIPVMAAVGIVAVATFWLFDLSAGWALLVGIVAIALELVAWRVLRPPTEEATPA